MDIILIPGFWLDASSWDTVVPALREAGHRTHPLTLPGMHAANEDRSEITLRDHVEAAVAAIDSIDTASSGIVLVGHSGGGAVAYAAADARPDRISRVIYVESGPLGDGDCINDRIPAAGGDAPLPDWSFFDDADLVDLDDELRAAFRHRAIPTPVRVARDAQQLFDERRYDVPVTVIACEMPSSAIKEAINQGHPYVRELAKIREVEYVDLPTGHWPQFTLPADLAKEIRNAVRSG